MTPAAQTTRPEIASHRGGAFLWPENSMTAFRETARLPVEQVECDVHLSADGEVVVMHDATLDRTTDAQGPVAARTAEELRSVRIRGTGGEGVPMLADLAALIHPTRLMLRVEIKADAAGLPYPGIVARTLAVLDAAGMRGRTVVIGFQAPTMAEAVRAGGLAGVAWLLETPWWRALRIEGAIAAARAHGVPEIGLPESQVDASVVSATRAAGLRLGTWGANHAASIHRMLALGVDVFATDDPPLALRLRG
jgi:glycerophosphoryl diester phosphodiesterase